MLLPILFPVENDSNAIRMDRQCCTTSITYSIRSKHREGAGNHRRKRVALHSRLM
jgi:hypothetical protein